MKRLLISLVAVLGILALTTTASAGHSYYGGPQRGFGISVGPGYYGGNYYSGYRGGYYGSPYYGGNGYYGGVYYSSPSYYYSSPVTVHGPEALKTRHFSLLGKTQPIDFSTKVAVLRRLAYQEICSPLFFSGNLVFRDLSVPAMSDS